jgi:lysophospholipase L1-like esterase
MRATVLAFALIAALAAPAFAQPAAPPKGPERFAPEIAAFAAADQAQPTAPCGVLFVGSSSIRFWRSLAADMAPTRVLNRGFGGSEIADVDFYFDKVVTPYRPRAIFFYAGDNDVNSGKTAEAIAGDFNRFMDLKDKALGKTPVYFISLKPSKLRWSQFAAQGQVNARIRALAAKRGDLHYVDVVPVMLADGKPKEIFVGDGLHMTPEGYALWTGVVRPVVEQEMKRPSACKAA